jgi:hypothetical protein
MVVMEYFTMTLGVDIGVDIGVDNGVDMALIFI